MLPSDKRNTASKPPFCRQNSAASSRPMTNRAVDSASAVMPSAQITVTEERPVFFVGYGHFDTAANDMPLFNEIGANTIQTEIGPTDVMTFADDGSYTIKTDKIEKLKTILENAEENNIAVSVLLSPHYFPTNVIEYYDIGHSDGATEFLKYNVNADIAKTRFKCLTEQNNCFVC